MPYPAGDDLDRFPPIRYIPNNNYVETYLLPFVIGIAGPSCSGKTSIACGLAAILQPATIFSLDAYYRDLRHLTPQEREKVNFDHPDALDVRLLLRDLKCLRRGEGTQQPVYNFGSHLRQKRTRNIAPGDYVIVEGLLSLYWATLRRLLDARVFVGIPEVSCLERRKARDVRERGRKLASVTAQDVATVRPMAERFVLPQQGYAELVVDGTAPLADSIQKIAHHIQALAGLRAKVPSTIVAR